MSLARRVWGHVLSTDDFFDEVTEQSEIKQNIVLKYFAAWANVMVPIARLGAIERLRHVDLFAGPGHYRDGTESTPLHVLRRVLANPELRLLLEPIFNDKDTNAVSKLASAIQSLEGIQGLRYAPQILNRDVDSRLLESIRLRNDVPALWFLDPWGYKGVSLSLISSMLPAWGSDLIVFFNYNRINAALDNEVLRPNMEALFGRTQLNKLKREIAGLEPAERETCVIEAFAQALREAGGQHVLPFRFTTEGGRRTSHHLVFVSKHFKGFEIMREIMAKESSSTDQGVASFTFNPADQRFPLLFELWRPLDGLGEMLMTDFAGSRIAMREIYECHSVGRRFVERNYKDALRKLEKEGRIEVEPPERQRKGVKGEVSFGPKVMVTFPVSGGTDGN
jgi:three-Cys-motif partner protein